MYGNGLSKNKEGEGEKKPRRNTNTCNESKDAIESIDIICPIFGYVLRSDESQIEGGQTRKQRRRVDNNARSSVIVGPQNT